MNKKCIYVGIVIGILVTKIFEEIENQYMLWLYDYSPSKMLAGSTRFKEQDHD